MLNNFRVKEFLSRLGDNGNYALEKSTIGFYPTIDIRNATTSTKTSAYTVVMSDLEKPTIFDNTGAGASVTFTLPAVTAAKNKVIRVYALAAQTIRLAPVSTDAVNYNGNAVVNKYAQLAGVIGNYMEAFCDGTQWIITQANGVVTKES